MKWCVYWQPDEVEMVFFKTADEAHAKVVELIAANEQEAFENEGKLPFWDITLMQIVGEVQQTPDGLKLKAVA